MTNQKKQFAKKIEGFVDEVKVEKDVVGHFNVIVKGEKKDLKRVSVAIKMSEEVELVAEGKKGGNTNQKSPVRLNIRNQ